VGVWACGRVGVWACGRIGVSEYRSIGVSEYWSIGRVGEAPSEPGHPGYFAFNAMPKIPLLNLFVAPAELGCWFGRHYRLKQPGCPGSDGASPYQGLRLRPTGRRPFADTPQRRHAETFPLTPIRFPGYVCLPVRGGSQRRNPPPKALALLPARQPGGNPFNFLTLPPPSTTSSGSRAAIKRATISST
jgi:hypothetical protein